MGEMTKPFERKLASLKKISAYILDFARKSNLDEKTIFPVNLVVEELFTNAVKHIKGNDNPVIISLSRDDDKLVISVIDTDVDSFDIRMTEEYDFKKKLEERKVGGLGIPLIHKIMDEIDYKYENRESRITLIKYLENKNVKNNN